MRYLRVPLLWSFLPVSMPLGRLQFLEANFLIYASVLVFTEFFCCLAGLPNGSRVHNPTLCCFLLWLQICAIEILLPALPLFIPLPHFYLCWPVPLLMIHFGKMSHGFFTGRDGSNTTTCFAICLWPEWLVLSALSLTDFERRDVIGHWLWCAPVISVVIGGLKYWHQNLPFRKLFTINIPWYWN